MFAKLKTVYEVFVNKRFSVCAEKSANSEKCFFSTPFLLIAYKRNGVEPPKKIRQRGASKTFGLLLLTIENSFVKTPPFYFRCRCAGANLRYRRSLAPPHPQTNQQRRRFSLARQTLTSSIRAAAIISGFACRLTLAPVIERCTTCLRPRKRRGS